jgi:hypothetical protein
MYRMRIQSFKEDETASSKESSRKMMGFGFGFY